MKPPERPSILTPEMLDKYEHYKKVDAWNAKESSMRALCAFVASILAAVVYLTIWADNLLPGLKYIPGACTLALVAMVVKLWAVCNWKISRSNAVGIDLVPRYESEITLFESCSTRCMLFTKDFTAQAHGMHLHHTILDLACRCGCRGTRMERDKQKSRTTCPPGRRWLKLAHFCPPCTFLWSHACPSPPRREHFAMDTAKDVAHIKEFLKANPIEGRRRRIIVCTASSGGGHEATTQGLKELLTEVAAPPLMAPTLDGLIKLGENVPVIASHGTRMMQWGRVSTSETACARLNFFAAHGAEESSPSSFLGKTASFGFSQQAPQGHDSRVLWCRSTFLQTLSSVPWLSWSRLTPRILSFQYSVSESRSRAVLSRLRAPHARPLTPMPLCKVPGLVPAASD